MNISENGIKLIKTFEGCMLTAVQDVVGVWTIGYGATNAEKDITGITIKKGTTITQAQADEFLRRTIPKKYIPKISKYDYCLTQDMVDALCSFCYNIGSIDNLTKNGTRNYDEIAKSMLLYNKAGGKVLKGLTNRRNAESKLFMTGIPSKGDTVTCINRVYVYDDYGKTKSKYDKLSKTLQAATEKQADGTAKFKLGAKVKVAKLVHTKTSIQIVTSEGKHLCLYSSKSNKFGFEKK